jgi:hypothetical protein
MAMLDDLEGIVDPLELADVLWPDVYFYKQQQEMIYSVETTPETVVVAGNMLGKDYVAGFVCVNSFLRHREARIVTTSVKDDHLRVLWGEIGRFIETAKYPLRSDKGGPLVIKHRDIGKIVNGKQCKISYLRGMVSERGEGMAGHHAAYTLAVIDEASGVDDIVYTQLDTWAKRKLIFGNPNPTGNFFRRMVKEGDILL